MFKIIKLHILLITRKNMMQIQIAFLFENKRKQTKLMINLLVIKYDVWKSNSISRNVQFSNSTIFFRIPFQLIVIPFLLNLFNVTVSSDNKSDYSSNYFVCFLLFLNQNAICRCAADLPNFKWPNIRKTTKTNFCQ